VRPSKPAYERPKNLNGGVGTSSASPTLTLHQAAINKLAMPVVINANLAMTQELEEQRQQILQEANEIVRARQELDITFREYNIAHCFTPVNNEPSRVGNVWNRGGNLNRKLARDVRSGASMSTTYVSVENPKYSTPAKNLRQLRQLQMSYRICQVKQCNNSKPELENYLISLTSKM
jgi:hypothetical protein